MDAHRLIRLPLSAALGILTLLSPFGHLEAVEVPFAFEVFNPFPLANFDAPVRVSFLADGRKLVAEIDGRVWVLLPSGEQLATPFIDLTDEVDGVHDLGLIGMAVDPEFDENGWVYLGYTVEPEFGAEDRYSRVTRYRATSEDENVADLSSREVLIGETWSEAIPTLHRSHSICALEFGADGSLLIGHGDGAHFEWVDSGGNDPGAFGPGRTDPAEDLGAFRAQTLESKAGKILRVDKDTGLGLPSNPYWDGDPDSDRSRVWLYGLRNPFRYSTRPGTGSADPKAPHPGVLYIGDVGWGFYEDFHIARNGGLNLGWPCYEGPNEQSSYQAVEETAAGNENALCGADPSGENPASPLLPDLWFHHTVGALSNPEGVRASSLTGGVFYTGTSYPAQYQNQYFLGDYTYGWIKHVVVDDDDNVLLVEPFLENGNGPVDIATDPASGDLYYVSIWDAKVYRIRFNDSSSTPEEVGWQTNPLQLRISPNPVAREATLRFVLPEGGPVRIRVFDLAGRVVGTPFEGLHLSAGSHELQWEVAGGPGVRFVRVECGVHRSAGKLVVG